MKRFLLVLFLLIVGAFVFAMVHGNAPPQNVWKRLADSRELAHRDSDLDTL